MSDAETITGKEERPENGSAPAATPKETLEAEEKTPAGQEISGRHGDTVAAALAQAESAEAASGKSADRCERVFRALSLGGPIFLLVVLAAQVWPDFWHALNGSQLYCPAEARNIESYLLSSAQGSWLTPGADGVAQWPVFTWLLLLLMPLVLMLTGSSALLFPLGGALGAALALLAVWGMARAAGFGAQAALAAGLLLLASPLFAPLGHFSGPAALAAALMIFSLLFFCRGWQAERAWCSLPAAFVLAGLAGLAGGPFFLLLPLIASFVFLIWRGGIRRAQALDALFGFLLLLLVLGAWLMVIILGKPNNGYLSQLFAGALHMPWPLVPRWWLAAVIAAVGLLPWILAVFGVSWFRVLRHAPTSLAASRRSGGAALLWIALVLGLLLLPCLPVAQAQMTAVALVSLAAPLLGKAILALPRLSGHLLYACAALLLLGCGVVLLGTSFELTQGALAGLLPITIDGQILEALRGSWALPLLGCICLLGTVIMARFVRGEHGGGGLVAASVLSVLLTQPATLMLAPDLANVPALRLQPLPAIEKAANAKLAPVGASTVAPISPAPTPPAPEVAPIPSVPTPPAPTPSAPEEAPIPPVPAAPAAAKPAEGLLPGPESGPASSASPAPASPALPEAGAPDAPKPEPEATSPSQGPISPANPEAAPVNTEPVPNAAASPAKAADAESAREGQIQGEAIKP